MSVEMNQINGIYRKMKMLKIISGSLMIVSLFVGLFVFITKESGFNMALEVFGILFAISFFVAIAVHLLVSGQED